MVGALSSMGASCGTGGVCGGAAAGVQSGSSGDRTGIDGAGLDGTAVTGLK
jgi:hypothetical protein